MGKIGKIGKIEENDFVLLGEVVENRVIFVYFWGFVIGLCVMVILEYYYCLLAVYHHYNPIHSLSSHHTHRHCTPYVHSREPPALHNYQS